MTTYIYPAVFHPNDDGSYTITFPDVPGCISEGKSLDNALYMAQDALSTWMEYAMDSGMEVSPASRPQDISLDATEFTSLIRAELKDSRAVRRTVSLPKWMDDKVSETGLSLSKVLQDALKDRLNAI